MTFLIIMESTANCGDPVPPANGHVVEHSHSREGASVTYMCNDGFRPSSISTSVCSDSMMWAPPLEEYNCTLVVGETTSWVEILSSW